MTKDIFPQIPRDELRRKVVDVLRAVATSGQSRAVYLYGDGGVGKTYFVRELAVHVGKEALEEADRRACWLGPYDIDDAEFWLIGNLEDTIVTKLTELGHGAYFDKYVKRQLELPKVRRQDVELENLLNYGRQGERVFFECYREFVQGTRLVPVLILDTVEAIRGLDFQGRLVRWLKELQGTFFVLASRPPRNEGELAVATIEADGGVADEADVLAAEIGAPKDLLAELHVKPPLPCVPLELRRFSQAESLDYLQKSAATHYELSPQELQAFAELAEGYPLWLVMGLEYLAYHQNEKPTEFAEWLTANEAQKKELRDDFWRRLIVPYSGSDFWSEAIRRLGVVRRRVDQAIWEALMADCNLPPDASSWDTAWRKLKDWPWVRDRTGGGYVTLHDAVAEALAQRVLPLEDEDGKSTQELWAKAAKIYREKVREDARALSDSTGQEAMPPSEARRDAARQVAYSLLVSTALYYAILSDRSQAMGWLVELYDAAAKRNDSQLMQLLWLELQRFLGEQPTYDPLADVVAPQLKEFRKWFWHRDQAKLCNKVGQRMARFLTYNGRPQEAFPLLDALLEAHQEATLTRYELLNLSANARFRMPGQAEAANRYFEEALALTDSKGGSAELRRKRSDALVEMAFNLGQTGHWKRARSHLSDALSVTPRQQKDELCRVHTQLAVLVARLGSYDEAGDSGSTARRLADSLVQSGESSESARKNVVRAYSISGEVSRYRGRYVEALAFLRRAEELATEAKDMVRLGVSSHRIAILYLKAAEAYREGDDDTPLLDVEPRAGSEPIGRDSTDLAPLSSERRLKEQYAEAVRRAQRSVELCRDYFLRELPLALNRAGRIFWTAAAEPWSRVARDAQQPTATGRAVAHAPSVSRFRSEQGQRGLTFLAEGIQTAREVADTWMLLANLVEFGSACTDAFFEEVDAESRAEAKALFEARVEEARTEFAKLDEDAFYALRGRWDVLQANLKLWDGLDLQDQPEASADQARIYDEALALYRTGLLQIAKGYPASRSSAALHRRILPMQQLIAKLPAETGEAWLDTLDREWKIDPDPDKPQWLPILDAILNELESSIRA